MSNDTDAPNVNRSTILLFSDNLRRHVKWRTKHLSQSALRLIEAGEAEISQFQIYLSWLGSLLWSQENVLRLDIPMDYVLLVHVVQREEQLLDNFSSLLLVKALDLNYVVV